MGARAAPDTRLVRAHRSGLALGVLPVMQIARRRALPRARSAFPPEIPRSPCNPPPHVDPGERGHHARRSSVGLRPRLGRLLRGAALDVETIVGCLELGAGYLVPARIRVELPARRLLFRGRLGARPASYAMSASTPFPHTGQWVPSSSAILT